MNGFPWESAIAILGLAIPVAAAAWEFALVGRKRLGYRIQVTPPPRERGGFSLCPLGFATDQPGP